MKPKDIVIANIVAFVPPPVLHQTLASKLLGRAEGASWSWDKTILAEHTLDELAFILRALKRSFVPS
jgi:hypothetical protein